MNSSNLPSLGNFSFILANKETLELPIDISFNYKLGGDTAQIEMQNILLNGFAINANTITIVYDHERKGFYGNLFFELWIFNDAANAFQYHQRCVSLWLNFSA